MASRCLPVETAYPTDSGNVIARLTPDTFMDLNLAPGDLIEIEGTDTTGAKVWRANHQEWDTETIRLDGFTRQNAAVSIGKSVEICPAEETAAVSLTFNLPEGLPAPVQFGTDSVEMIKRHLLSRPVVERDFVPLIADSDYSSRRSPVHTIFLIAAATDPHGVVRLTDETTVTIQEATK
jgi:transitional endoplasmic reticulum ATPase